ncbi:MAG: hypothetical protein ACJ74O_17930 [Frankiaceae bacterium]
MSSRTETATGRHDPLVHVVYLLFRHVGPNPPGTYTTVRPYPVAAVTEFVDRWLPVVASDPAHGLAVVPVAAGSAEANPPIGVVVAAGHRPGPLAGPDAERALAQAAHEILSAWTWRYREFVPGAQP